MCTSVCSLEGTLATNVAASADWRERRYWLRLRRARGGREMELARERMLPDIRAVVRRWSREG